MDRLLHPIPEAVKISGLSRSTLYNFIAAGELKVTKVGRRSYIADAELKRFIAALVGEGAK
ncbi:hypothetical protein USB125703_02061 [Pseudoclavibacter triregionum]|nr:hypothetical protein USB125703_02061 [Pseudoclavibacter triregionum]